MGSLKPTLAVSGAMSSVHVALGFDWEAAFVERMKSEGLVPPASATAVFPVLSRTLSVAVNSFPEAAGAKVTAIWQLSFLFKLPGQLLGCSKAAGFVPVTLAPLKLSGCSPALLTLTICAGLVLPFAVAGN